MRNRLFVIAMLAGCAAAPALAQSTVESRVGRLEGEMRAVQRKVFPGGNYLEPQIAPSQAPVGPGPGTPASSPVADLSARVTSLEQQQQTLTGQIEQNQYRVRQLEDAFAAYRRTTDAKLASAAPAPDPAAAPASRDLDDDRPASAPPRAVSTRPTVPSKYPARAALVAKVERPTTDDAAEDAYLYGYRLWAAKLYPEAAVELKGFVAANPKHRRASYAQNLLGRSYLDDGKPSLASIAFYDNYKKMPDGERAPDSLFYLGQALVKLNKPADACKVYGELTDVYGTKISASMTADIARNRTAAKCR